jgi:alkylhydroperoxidase family enzyme
VTRAPRGDAVQTEYDELIERLRAAARPARPAPAAMRRYLEKVRSGAFAVSDRDVERLLEDGLAEDEIFEQTVTVAVEAGLERLDAALGTLR